MVVFQVHLTTSSLVAIELPKAIRLSPRLTTGTQTPLQKKLLIHRQATAKDDNFLPVPRFQFAALAFNANGRLFQIPR